MPFVKATKHTSKLRLALTGPSGSGKTWGALQIAKGLGGRIACIDTERGSASLYAHIVDFDVMELSAPFTPESFVLAIKEAERAGYDTLIIDSATHEWSGTGGYLEIRETIAKARYKGNPWAASSETGPRHRAFVDAMLHSSMHIIATARSKTETAQQEVNGRKTVVKLGMKTEQKDDFDYEFTLVLDISHDGNLAIPSKNRTPVLKGDPSAISEETGKQLLAWLEDGEEPPKEPEPPTYESIISTIDSAATVEELKTAFIQAKKFAAGNELMLGQFIDAKDLRKAQLTNEEAPNVVTQ
jgi:hypothetical protein